MKEYKKLPELDVLPTKPKDEIEDLRIDLLRRGYDPQDPIMIWKGHDIIVDGHHRYDICREEGIEPIFKEEEFENVDAVLCYIWKHYIQPDGRKKTKTQQAAGTCKYEALVEKISQAAKERKWSGKHTNLTSVPTEGIQEEPGESSKKLAKIAGTGATIIKEVLRVKRDGVPELEDMMIYGDISSNMAKDFVKNVPKHEQEKIVKEGGANAVKNTVSKIREVDRNAKKFDEFNDPIKEKTERVIGDMQKLEKLTGGACLMPNLRQLYCNTCKWGFDVYIPPPLDARYCPYCCGTDIVDRDPYWNSRLAMYNE